MLKHFTAEKYFSNNWIAKFMLFTQTELQGAFIIDLVLHQDNRGFFARTFCAQEFTNYGLNPRIVQCNLSFISEILK